MNMNKTLIAAALAAATLGASSAAMALTFTDGAFTGSTDLSGTVTVPVATNYWQWAAGDAITYASIPVTQLTNSYKTLTLPAATNKTLLVGQTKQATVGQPGSTISPQIAFKDAAGNVITPNWVATGNTGKGTMTLPVTAADGTTALGSMTMTVKVAAFTGLRNGVGVAAYSVAYNAPGQLFGPVATSPSPLSKGTLALAWANALGVTKTSANILSDLSAVYGSTLTAFDTDSTSQAWPYTNPTEIDTGAYGLGIAQGDNIVVNFTNPVTANTVWKAPLKMTVTYI